MKSVWKRYSWGKGSGYFTNVLVGPGPQVYDYKLKKLRYTAIIQVSGNMPYTLTDTAFEDNYSGATRWAARHKPAALFDTDIDAMNAATMLADRLYKKD